MLGREVLHPQAILKAASKHLGYRRITRFPLNGQIFAAPKAFDTLFGGEYRRYIFHELTANLVGYFRGKLTLEVDSATLPPNALEVTRHSRKNAAVSVAGNQLYALQSTVLQVQELLAPGRLALAATC